MFGFIRSISLSAQVSMPFLALLFFAAAWFLPGITGQTDPPFGGIFHLPEEGWLYTNWITLAGMPLWMQILPAFAIAVILAMVLIGTDMDNLLMGRRSYAMGLVFIFLLVSGGHYQIFHPATLAAIGMVISTRFLLQLYKNETDYARVFVIGFCWGSAVLLYPPAALVCPAILVGLLFMVTTTWRHWVVVILGILMPLAVAAAVWHLLGDLDYELRAMGSWFEIRHGFIPDFLKTEPFIAAWFALILVWIVIATLGYRNPRIQSRQLFQANFIWFLLSLVALAAFQSVSAEILWILIIPVTYLMTYWALEQQRGWLRDLFFVSLLIPFVFFRIRGLI